MDCLEVSQQFSFITDVYECGGKKVARDRIWNVENEGNHVFIDAMHGADNYSSPLPSRDVSHGLRFYGGTMLRMLYKKKEICKRS